MKIVKMVVQDFMRVHVVEIKPDGNLVKIEGRNGEGKSSCILGMIAALGGAKFAPEDPVRHGAEVAKVLLDLEDIVVTAKWTEAGPSLVITNKDGFRTAKPQTYLDRLTSHIAFDPLAFSRLKPKEQAAKLREVTGVDTTKLDAQYKEVYACRTDVNKMVKAAETQIAAIVIPPIPPKVGDEIDLVAINEKKIEAARVKSENARKVAAAATASDIAQKALEEITRLEKLLEHARKNYEIRSQEAVDAQEAAKDLVDPDTSVIDMEVAAARKHNEAVKVQFQEATRIRGILQKRADLEAERDKFSNQSTQLTEKIEKIEAAKRAMLAKAKFPIPGMSIDGDDIFINGVPFSQASTAEMIRVGLEISSSLNPELRVIFCREGGLLDPQTMQMIADWADLNDMQIWLEVVSGGEGSGLIIENGYLKTIGD